MVKHWQIPEEVHCSATASVIGILAKQPAIATATGSKQRITRGTILVDLIGLPFVAYDAIADRMSVLPAGTIIDCTGTIQVMTWDVGNSGKRERLEIQVDSLETRGRATEQ